MSTDHADRPLVATFGYDDYRDLDAAEVETVLAPPPDGDWSEIAELVDDNDEDEGAVIISQGDVVVRVDDSLTATVANLCLGAIDDLIAKRHVVVPYFITYGYLRLDPEGDLQLVSGDYVPTVRFPRSKLIPALVDVAEQYLAFLRTCRDTDEYGPITDDIATKLDGARHSLDAWDGR